MPNQHSTAINELHYPMAHLERKAPVGSNVPGGMDAMQYAFLQLYECVQTGRQTAQIQARSAMVNITQQNNMINLESQENFSNLSWHQLFTYKTVTKVTYKIIKGKKKKVKVKVQETVEKKDASGKLTQLADRNEEISAIRSVMQSKVNVLGQANNIDNANLNNTLTITEQSISAASKTEQELGNLTVQIARALA